MRIITSIFLGLLFLSLVSAQGEPFVENGKIVATIVVGEDAPSDDVILGAQIAAHFQQYATKTTTGLAKTSKQVDLEDLDVAILMGLPENNPFIEDTLNLEDGELSGPYVTLLNTDEQVLLIVSGNTQKDVADAVLLVRGGTYNKGSIIHHQKTTKRSFDEEVKNALPVREEKNISTPVEVINEESKVHQNKETPTEQITTLALKNKESCERELFCDEYYLKERQENCGEILTQYCVHGCENTQCKDSIWSRIKKAFIFWQYI